MYTPKFTTLQIELLIFKFYFVSDAINDFKSLQDENSKYLYIYTLIGMVNSVATFFRAFIFAYCGIKACKVIHDCLLTSIMNVCICKSLIYIYLLLILHILLIFIFFSYR